MSKTSLVVMVVILATLLVASNMALLAAMRAQGKALDDIAATAKLQSGWVYFPAFDMGKASNE